MIDETEELAMLLCIISILLWRNERKDSHFEVVKELEILSMGLRSLLIVEKRDFGLLLPDCITEE